MKNEMPIDTLREWLAYEPETGILIWKKRKARCVWPGDVAGSRTKFGYLRVALDGRRYSCHRVAWALHHNEWPRSDLDHINGDRADNRICNMRIATRAQNSQNQGIKASNSSGVKGVSWGTKIRRWRVHIRAQGRAYPLGTYKCLGKAAKAYRDAAKCFHGEFVRIRW